MITFNNSNVLASVNNRNIATTFDNGWVALNFFPGPGTIVPPVHQLIGGATFRQNTGTGALIQQVAATYNGLPVVGFAAQSFHNGTIPQYIGTFIHKYTRLIQ